MGTRSTTHIYDENRNHLVSIYRQYDGYPTGHGQELANFLNGKKLVNGFGDPNTTVEANGMGCLSAQFIAHFKTGIGNVYITTKDDRQEYNYFVELKDGELHLKVESEYYGLLYVGKVSDFNGATVEAMAYSDEEEVA